MQNAVADGTEDLFLYLRLYFETRNLSVLQTVAQDLKFPRFLPKNLCTKVNWIKLAYDWFQCYLYVKMGKEPSDAIKCSTELISSGSKSSSSSSSSSSV